MKQLNYAKRIKNHKTKIENNKKKTLFIVVPVYNEKEMVSLFLDRLTSGYDDVTNDEVRRDFVLDVIFVDDGSSDTTLDVIKSVQDDYKKKRTDIKIDYVSFSKNYGKECAFLAGFSFCDSQSTSKDDMFGTMDVDLEDRPSDLFDMTRRLVCQKDVERVYARTKRRENEGKLYSFLALSFYKVFSFLTGLKRLKGGSRDFSVFRKSFLKALLNDKNPRRFFKGLVLKVGFKEEEVLVETDERVKGTSKFNFVKLFKYAITGINASSNILYYVLPSLFSFVSFILMCVFFSLNIYLGLILMSVFLISLTQIYLVHILNRNNKENLRLVEKPYNVKEESR